MQGSWRFARLVGSPRESPDLGVQFLVVGTAHGGEVLDAVVESVLVDVVDDEARWERSMSRLPHGAMGKDGATPSVVMPLNSAVAVATDRPGPTRRTNQLCRVAVPFEAAVMFGTVPEPVGFSFAVRDEAGSDSEVGRSVTSASGWAAVLPPPLVVARAVPASQN